jgi:CubicO group peptidase (beta-lactamase class C family)
VVGHDGVLATAGDVSRRFALASVTKVVTATAVLVAIEEGTLRADDPAGPPGSTIGHLAAHASGLGPDGGVLAPPGQRRIYSNAGFEVLADELGRAAGMTRDRYVREAVLEPLGMTATDVAGSPASGATSCVRDLVALAAAWLMPGRLLARTTVDDATRTWFPGLRGVLPGFGAHDPNDWGFGVERRSDKRPHWTGSHNSPATFGHFGQSGTFVWVDPVAGCSLVVLTDEPFGAWATKTWPALSDAVLAQLRGGIGFNSSYGTGRSIQSRLRSPVRRQDPCVAVRSPLHGTARIDARESGDLT